MGSCLNVCADVFKKELVIHTRYFNEKMDTENKINCLCSKSTTENNDNIRIKK